jgi:RNA polymerase sigma-70 factor, ECF subfamily
MARELTKASTEELLLLASGPAKEPLLALAVAELVTRYKGVVYNQALRICGGNRALADETFQETFLRLFEWLRSRQDKGTLHTFPRLLSVFTKRAAIDLMRRENRETPTGSRYEAEALPAEDEPSFETRAYAVELLEMLDDRSREVIRLTYFDGLSAVEIAQRLSLTPGNVRILRFRALEALRAMQQRDEMADSIEPL